MATERIRNKKTGVYMRIAQRNTKRYRKGQIIGKWSKNRRPTNKISDTLFRQKEESAMKIKIIKAIVDIDACYCCKNNCVGSIMDCCEFIPKEWYPLKEPIGAEIIRRYNRRSQH